MRTELVLLNLIDKMDNLHEVSVKRHTSAGTLLSLPTKEEKDLAYEIAKDLASINLYDVDARIWDFIKEKNLRALLRISDFHFNHSMNSNFHFFLEDNIGCVALGLSRDELYAGDNYDKYLQLDRAETKGYHAYFYREV